MLLLFKLAAKSQYIMQLKKAIKNYKRGYLYVVLATIKRNSSRVETR